jgi:membrane protein implicated in regulation of membrane protease activity
MMKDMNFLNSPKILLWSGIVCVLLGFILPFLIVIKIIENTFALSFFIYILQIVGMILGVMAAASLALERRRKDKAKGKKQEENQEEQEEQEDTIGWMK